ncbi:MAG: DGQHR domain-containing protein [Acidobacteria bacterium]|nr:DGQHR domain-containing protein [Acidobacteriota bacterium]
MTTLPALRLTQFGITFYETTLSARDVERLVRFEVLSYDEGESRRKQRAPRPGRVNWNLLESKITSSRQAYQRPIIRKKIEELVQYYQERQEHRDLPAIPGSVLLVSDQPLQFKPSDDHPNLGTLVIPDVPGVLHTLDGQHRILALYAYSAQSTEQGMPPALAELQIPTTIFDSLLPAHAVEMFVTINTKHTRLKSDLIVSLSGRKLYPDRKLAIAHDIVRYLNESEASPLKGQIRVLGVGPGKISQAPLAAEMETLFTNFEAAGEQAADEFYNEAKQFFLAYFRQIAQTFPQAWEGRKYSIKTGTAFRAFLRVAPDILVRLRRRGGSLTDARAIGEIIAPWATLIGDQRFETLGQWREKSAGGGSRTVDLLAAELRNALGA